MEDIRSPEFDIHVEELLKDWHIPGLACAFVVGDEVCSKGFGYASFESKKPCTPDSLFDIASCSKSFTAASVGILVRDIEAHPKIKWDAPMSKLLPEDFVMAEDEYTRGVTVEDILSHRSGLPGHDTSYLGLKAKEPDTPKSVTRNLRNLPITAPIRTKYQYCNLMYTVAVHLIETLTKLPFEEFLQKHIFSPLGMTSTHLALPAVEAAGLSDRLTSPHVWLEKKERIKILPWIIEPEAYGAGSICTSANDLIRYVQALLNYTGPFTQELVSDLTHPRIITNSSLEELGPFSSYMLYALGWETSFYRGYQIVRHDGCIDGFTAICFFLPDMKAGGVVLANSGDGNTVCEILMKVFVDSVLQIPKADRTDWTAQAKKREAEAKADHEDAFTTLQTSLFQAGQTEPEPLTTPLDVYTGSYHNAGYHTYVLEEREGQLFIHVYDRSVPFSLRFVHVHSQWVFIARLVGDAYEEDTDEWRAEFEFDASDQSGDGQGRAVRMGLAIEEQMGNKLIWFDRISD